MDRRKFLQQGTILGLTASVAPSWLASCADSHAFIYTKKGIGIQLYSVRELFAKDAEMMLQKIAETGFSHVETFGWTADRNMLTYPVKHFKSSLQAHQLKTYSGHYYIPEVLYEKKWDIWKKAIEDAQTLGQDYVIIPWVDVERVKKIGGITYLVDVANEAAGYCKQAGIKCAYHNHAFEFENTYKNKTWMDYLIDSTDPEQLHLQIDLYWVKAAKLSVREFLAKHQNRVYLWHIKDMNKNDTHQTETVGKGSIDYGNVLRPAYADKLLYPIYEQEHGMETTEEAFKAMQQSFDYISKFIKKKV